MRTKRSVDSELEKVEGIGLYVLSRYMNHVCPGSVHDNVGVASPLPSHRRYAIEYICACGNASVCIYVFKCVNVLFQYINHSCWQPT